MPLDWLNTPLDADIGELLARKKRAKAIDTLRRQLQGRLAPPVTVRLQLADLLMQAGRIEEAVPVLLGIADEFAADGFVAKAVAILKRVDRVQPGRADIAERLEKLVRQQKRVSALPLPAPRPSTPEFGMEELDEGKGLSLAEAEAAPVDESLPSLPVDGGMAAPGGYDEAVEMPPEVASPEPASVSGPMTAEIEVEATADEPEGPERALEPAVEATVEPAAALAAEPMAEPIAEPVLQPMPDEIRASPVEPIVDAEKLEPAEDEAAPAWARPA